MEVIKKLGRKPIPEEDVKDKVYIRLPRWLIRKILEKDTMQKTIEEILSKYYKK